MNYPIVNDQEKIAEIGFDQGITICHDQLESLLTEYYTSANRSNKGHLLVKVRFY